MVSIPGILSPPTTRWGIRHQPSLEPEIEHQMQVIFDQMSGLIQPLASVRTRQELERELGRRSQDYLHLKNELWHTMLNVLPQEEVANFALEAYREISLLIGEDTRVLGDKERTLLLELIDDSRDLLMAVVDSWEARERLLTDVLLECSVPLQRADMCVSSVVLVLVDEIKYWNMASIKLLSQAAGEYMSQVEDIFLLHDDELAKRLRGKGEVVSFAEIRRDLGLPG